MSTYLTGGGKAVQQESQASQHVAQTSELHLHPDQVIDKIRHGVLDVSADDEWQHKLEKVLKETRDRLIKCTEKACTHMCEADVQYAFKQALLSACKDDTPLIDVLEVTRLTDKAMNALTHGAEPRFATDVYHIPPETAKLALINALKGDDADSESVGNTYDNMELMMLFSRVDQALLEANKLPTEHKLLSESTMFVELQVTLRALKVHREEMKDEWFAAVSKSKTAQIDKVEQEAKTVKMASMWQRATSQRRVSGLTHQLEEQTSMLEAEKREKDALMAKLADALSTTRAALSTTRTATRGIFSSCCGKSTRVIAPAAASEPAPAAAAASNGATEPAGPDAAPEEK